MRSVASSVGSVAFARSGGSSTARNTFSTARKRVGFSSMTVTSVSVRSERAGDFLALGDCFEERRRGTAAVMALTETKGLGDGNVAQRLFYAREIHGTDNRMRRGGGRRVLDEKHAHMSAPLLPRAFMAHV